MKRLKQWFARLRAWEQRNRYKTGTDICDRPHMPDPRDIGTGGAGGVG